MFEDLFRTLMPQGGALTPDQIEEARRRAGALPAAPSGQFFQVPADSPDPQAGKLLPLSGGQPTPVMAKGLDFPSVFGAQQADVPRASTEGINPLALQVAPPSAPQAPVPKDAFGTGSLFGIPTPGAAPASAPKGDIDQRQWFDARGGMSPEANRSSVLSNNPDFAMRFDMEKQGAPAQTGGPEDTIRRALTLRDQVRGQYGAFTPDADNAMRAFMGMSMQGQSDQGKQALQSLENQGRLDVANAASGGRGGGDTFNTAKLKALDGIRTGQITPGQLQSSMGLLSGNALKDPAAMDAAVKQASAQAQADAEIGGLRSMLGVDPKTGQSSTPPTGQAFSALIDRMKPEMMPQIVEAIRAGQFGDPTAVRGAAANSLAQNYLMSQGRLPGGDGNVPGQYTIPYDNKPLMDLISSPSTNIANSVQKKAGFAQSGVPYDMIRLPDGTQIPFDQSGVQGMSNMAATLGYNQHGPVAKNRLSRIAQLNKLLQETQPPR